MMKDLHNSIKCSSAEPPVAALTNLNTPFVSTILDTAGFGSAEFVGHLGTDTDADVTFTVLVEDGDNSALSDAAAVADAHLLGVEAMALDFASDNKVFKIGYVGPKRYVRVTLTPSANGAGDVFFAAIWIQGHPRKGPQSTQVV
jgi:hypothetical protein